MAFFGMKNAIGQSRHFFWVDWNNSERLRRSPSWHFSKTRSKNDDFCTFFGSKWAPPSQGSGPTNLPKSVIFKPKLTKTSHFGGNCSVSNHPWLGAIDASRADFWVVWFVRASAFKRQQSQRLRSSLGRVMHWLWPGNDWFLKNHTKLMDLRLKTRQPWKSRFAWLWSSAKKYP